MLKLSMTISQHVCFQQNSDLNDHITPFLSRIIISIHTISKKMDIRVLPLVLGIGLTATYSSFHPIIPSRTFQLGLSTAISSFDKARSYCREHNQHHPSPQQCRLTPTTTPVLYILLITNNLASCIINIS